jgi:uncharacterized phage-associated protein
MRDADGSQNVLGRLLFGKGGIAMKTSTMRAPFAATAVAAWFVEHVADDSEQDLTPLKLQKLVYLAHSLYMHRFRVPLIEDDVQAWKDGPVVKAVYGVYKSFQNAPIALVDRNLVSRSWPAEAEQTFSDVWGSFGGYSALKLRSITHEAGPWKQVWAPDSRNLTIPNDAIRDAWVQFERYAESPLVARTNNTSAALARYSILLNDLPTQNRRGNVALLDDEAAETSSLRRRASTQLE